MESDLLLRGLVLIVGNYGSGKTEVAISLAVHQHHSGVRVQLADLDLVNPYFRTREARHALAQVGIDIVLPPRGWLQADLPILVPQVAGLIRQPNGLAILDVGGDGVGATVLAALADAFRHTPAPIQMLQVINAYRPNTDTVARCLAMRDMIEAASGLKVTGWVGNSHMMDETTVAHVRHGHALMLSLAEASGLPLACMAVSEDLLPQIGPLAITCPVLPLRRQLVPPWAERSPLNGVVEN
ncbi:MAG: cobalamin biosynthesis protein CbiA [Desulfatitalea sp.]|nr:cobalamin biosynthesis protein CbiA [Desulfatitalea sp.]NNK01235.1 cobalamin biosynthesis protein CbiA [Desulfatitalea sp.]